MPCHNLPADISEKCVTLPSALPLYDTHLAPQGFCYHQEKCNYSHDRPSPKIGPVQPFHNPAMNRQSATKCPSQDEYAKHLPREFIGGIPVNDEGYRLDIYCPIPSKKEIDAYYDRISEKKFCNNYYLGGTCDEQDSCQYGHTGADSATVHVMRYFSQRAICNKAGNCRKLNCFCAHHCQQGGCEGYCRFGRNAHIVNITVAERIMPVQQEETYEVEVSPCPTDDALPAARGTDSTLATLTWKC